MKKIFLLPVLFLLFSFSTKEYDTITQVSTLQALQEGYYDGAVQIKEIKSSGDIGIGTIDKLDGELIELDNNFYQIKSDGNVYKVNDLATTPFIITTVFNSDKKLEVDNIGSLKELQDYLESILPSKNIIYAFKIDSVLKYVKTRSVPAQNKPYPRLIEAVKNQSVFEYNNVKGTIVGFWFPAYLSGVNMSGFHFHFITDDKKHGGHLLEINLEKAIVDIDYSNNFKLILPSNSGFFNVNLDKNNSNELLKIEN